jgi:hypothetical protein
MGQAIPDRLKQSIAYQISNNYLFSMYGSGFAATLQLNVSSSSFKPENLEAAVMQAGKRSRRIFDLASHLVALAGGRGCGITAIATNLAIAWQNRPRKSRLSRSARALSCSGQFLNVKSSIIDLIQNVDHLDSQFMENVLHKYKPNLSILLGNPDLTLSTCSALTDKVLNKIFKILEGSFEWIVVDLGYWIDSIYLSVVRKPMWCYS